MEVREASRRPTAAIRTSTPVQDLPGVLGKGYGELLRYASQRGIDFTGPPYAFYFNADMEDLQIEMGFPVSSGTEVAEEGRVASSALPGGRTAVTLHVGPYSAIGEAFQRLTAEVAEAGLEPTGQCYEVYIDDPDTTDPEKLRTEVCFPLKE